MLGRFLGLQAPHPFSGWTITERGDIKRCLTTPQCALTPPQQLGLGHHFLARTWTIRQILPQKRFGVLAFLRLRAAVAAATIAIRHMHRAGAEPLDGETEFSFTDENIACPITLNVTLIPSDGASLEGAPWQFFAPVATQNVGTEPFAVGTVGTNNSITIENLIAGDYRLVVDATGYEQLDTVIEIADGEETHNVRLDVIALQPSQTPTPEPTAIPTIEPTVEPTIEPTTAPTEEPTPDASPYATPASTETTPPTDEARKDLTDVTGLPSTGSGSTGGHGILALAGLLAAMMLGAIGRRRPEP